MPSSEFIILRTRSEPFNTAVYRFLEKQRGAAGDSSTDLKSEPFGPLHRKTLTLWSDQALLDFSLFWAGFQREHQGHSPHVRALDHGSAPSTSPIDEHEAIRVLLPAWAITDWGTHCTCCAAKLRSLS